MERTIQILDHVIKVSLLVFVVSLLFSISITQISFTIGGLAWLVRVQITHSWMEVQRPLALVFLFFVLASILAVITAVEPGYSFTSLKKLLQIIIFFWVANSLKSEGQIDLLIKTLIVAACAASAYGFYQAITLGVSQSSRVEGTQNPRGIRIRPFHHIQH